MFVHAFRRFLYIIVSDDGKDGKKQKGNPGKWRKLCVLRQAIK